MMIAFFSTGITVALALIGLLIKMANVQAELTATMEALRRDLERNERAHSEIFSRLREVEKHD